jgi:hypothetical protein
MSALRIQIASSPDREKVVAELWWGDEMWGEISQEGPEPQLELYPRRDGRPWSFPLAEALDLIQRARRTLLGER